MIKGVRKRKLYSVIHMLLLTNAREIINNRVAQIINKKQQRPGVR